MSDGCEPHHDYFNALLTFGLCCGLVISYLPQHFRIIHAKSSEGFSPVFLLLGTTSATSGMFNMITLQAPIVKCCRVVSFGSCVEMTAGVVQVGLVWFCFSIIFVLYMIYYPEHLKYIEVGHEVNETLLHRSPIKGPLKSAEWYLSIIVAWIAVAHFVFLASFTAYLLFTVSPAPTPTGSVPPAISAWATFLGVSAALLATIQYAPQLLHTYRMKLVGALSIPSMMIQTPGGILMVTSIVLRPGTNWTSWITFAVAAILQGCLLAMCIAWKMRQHKLQIDDFGNSLHPSAPPLYSDSESVQDPHQPSSLPEEDDEPVPGLITKPSENPLAVRLALAAALESAAESDLRSPRLAAASGHGQLIAGEETPLLAQQARSKKSNGESGWFSWFGR